MTIMVEHKTITKDDLRACKMATTVSFHHSKNGSMIRLMKKNEMSSPFNSDEGERKIFCDGAVYCYAEDSSKMKLDSVTCYEMLHFTTVENSQWHIVCHLLREGDEISLEWVGDNNNDHIRGVGYSHDELYLRIKRNGKLKFRVFLEDSIGPSNSLARMIRL